MTDLFKHALNIEEHYNEYVKVHSYIYKNAASRVHFSS